MWKSTFNDQYYNIADDLQQDVEDTIDYIFGEEVSNDKREELLNSISFVIQKYERKYLNYLKYDLNDFSYSQLPNYNRKIPFINLYILTPTNSFQAPNLGYYQPPLNSFLPQNSYPNPMIQPQPYIQPLPALNFVNQPPIAKPQSSKKSDKSESKSKSHKHDKKHSAKNKHSKSEKSDKKQKKKFKGKGKKSQYFKFDKQSESELNGIIRYLTKKCGGNVDEKGVVRVTSSSICNDRGQKESDFIPRNAVDLDNKGNNFVSRDNPGQWLKYDFINYKVRPTNYSIRSRSTIKCHNPKNWVIEGSNNDNDWTILDSQTNCPYLNDLDVIHTFDIKGNSDESYRYLRIRQSDKNHTGQNYFIFSALEYFGYLYHI